MPTTIHKTFMPPNRGHAVYVDVTSLMHRRNKFAIKNYIVPDQSEYNPAEYGSDIFYDAIFLTHSTITNIASAIKAQNGHANGSSSETSSRLEELH